MPRSHLRVKPSRKSHVRRFSRYWELSGTSRGSYGMCVAVTGCTWQPSSKRLVDEVASSMHPMSRKSPYVALMWRLYVKVWLRHYNNSSLGKWLEWKLKIVILRRRKKSRAFIIFSCSRTDHTHHWLKIPCCVQVSRSFQKILSIKLHMHAGMCATCAKAHFIIF